jgi:hypothetical protein
VLCGAVRPRRRGHRPALPDTCGSNEGSPSGGHWVRHITHATRGWCVVLFLFFLSVDDRSFFFFVGILSYLSYFSDGARVWTCGYNFFGALGHGHEKSVYVPTLVECFEKEKRRVRQAKGGFAHSVFLLGKIL